MKIKSPFKGLFLIILKDKLLKLNFIKIFCEKTGKPFLDAKLSIFQSSFCSPGKVESEL